MLPVSAAFLAAVRGSHGMVTESYILTTPGATGANPGGTNRLTVLDGSVTLVGSADIRGTLDMTVSAPWPAGTDTQSLVPYGTEIAVSVGVVYGNGVIERAPLGIYGIQMAEQDVVPDGPIRITGQDRMAGLIAGKLLAPLQYVSGTTLGFVVSDLVTGIYPSAVIQWDDATNLLTLPRAAIVEQDRYQFLRDLVTSYGKIMYFDYRGALVIKSPPDPTVSVFSCDAGHNGVLVSATRSLSRDGVCNGVVASGEAADDFAPARAVAIDADPTSPTYWYGAFGKVPYFLTSPNIFTSAQARAAARAKLLVTLGLPYSVDFSIVPNAALEPLDAVTITYPDPNRSGGQGVSELHVLDQVTIGLSPTTALTAKTRLQSLAGALMGDG